MTRYVVACLLAFALTPAAPAWAHGGEDHDHGVPAPTATKATSGTTSRAATSEQFELVLTLDVAQTGADRHAHLYLSDYATNAPVSGAKVQVEWGHELVTAATATQQPGVYAATVRFPAAGDYAPLVTVGAKGQDDLLTLDAIPVSGPAQGQGNSALLLGGGAILLATGAAWWWRQRPRTSRPAEVQP
jgi:hypothetical protein